jgi:deoxyribodipyrimidine photolyase-related protein
MSQFADGIVGTKPYVSSASYINKMSHYCGDCFYDKEVKLAKKRVRSIACTGIL